MMWQAVSATFLLGANLFGVAQLPPSRPPTPVDGVKGTVIRPLLGLGKAKESRVSMPGQYTAKVGDLVEIEYNYISLVSPKKVTVKVSDGGAVASSELGVRFVEDGTTAQQRIVFYFIAKKAGKDTATIDVDGNQYEYKFEVAEAKK